MNSFRQKTEQAIRFFKKDIWHISSGDMAPWAFFCIKAIRHLYAALSIFTTRRLTDMAQALTYSTLLAIVPISAVVFAIARGFGFSIYLEQSFKEALNSQPQVADTIINFVNSYLVHAKSGVILGIGMLFMLFTVLMLTAKIEGAFNTIWQVKVPRTLFRTITDYLAMFFLVPIIIVLTSGISIFVTTVADHTEQMILFGPFMRFAIEVLPYIIMSSVFIGLYIFMPNTHVKFLSALVPGIIAGVAMQCLQLFYIHAQIFLSSYNAIYGSFAALPLFMLWLNISWTICLFGAELSYTIQNSELYHPEDSAGELSPRYHIMLCGLLLSKIAKRFEEEKRPYSALELKQECKIPVSIIQDLLYDMQTVRLISTVTLGTVDDILRYQPAVPLRHLTLGTLVDRMEAKGTWTVNMDLRPLIESEEWQNFYQLRKQYLNQLSDIPITRL